MTDPAGTGATLLLERLLVVVNEGRRTGTHKLLALLALMDATAASVGDDLQPALELPVRTVADHILSVAWPHVVPFTVERDAVHLRQMNDQGRVNELVEATGAHPRIGRAYTGPRRTAHPVAPGGCCFPAALQCLAPTPHRVGVRAGHHPVERPGNHGGEVARPPVRCAA